MDCPHAQHCCGPLTGASDHLNQSKRAVGFLITFHSVMKLLLLATLLLNSSVGLFWIWKLNCQPENSATNDPYFHLPLVTLSPYSYALYSKVTIFACSRHHLPLHRALEALFRRLERPPGPLASTNTSSSPNHQDTQNSRSSLVFDLASTDHKVPAVPSYRVLTLHDGLAHPALRSRSRSSRASAANSRPV